MAGEIWLADVARAFAAVRPTTRHERHSIARLLGFAPTTTQIEPEPPPQPEAIDETYRDADTGSMPAQESESVSVSSGSLDLPLLKPIGQEPLTATGWGVQSLPPVTAQHLAAITDHEPLLAQRTAAGILQAAVARRVSEGPLDIPAIVDLLARREPVERLPCELVRTLRFGVQVLIDIGESLQPFGRDQTQLVTEIRKIVGAERVDVLYFADSPARGAGPGAARTWRRYEPPDPGTRVFVVSELGMAGPALHLRRSQPDEWRWLIDELRRHRCDAVALVPLPPNRWSPTLSALLPLVCWDRSTTMNRVLASVDWR